MWLAELGGHGAQTRSPGPAHTHLRQVAGAGGCAPLASSTGPALHISEAAGPRRSPWLSLAPGCWGHGPALRLLLTSAQVPETSAPATQTSASQLSHVKAAAAPRPRASSDGDSRVVPQRDSERCSVAAPVSPLQGVAPPHGWAKAQLLLHRFWTQVFRCGLLQQKRRLKNQL